MALVRDVIFCSIWVKSMLKVLRSISQKMTLPPRCSTTLAVEIQVNAGMIASSPGPKPKAASDRCKAVVQEVTAMLCSAPVNLDHLSSNSRTYGPCTNQPERSGSSTLLISSSVRLVLAIGIFIVFLKRAPRLSGALPLRQCAWRASRQDALTLLANQLLR